MVEYLVESTICLSIMGLTCLLLFRNSRNFQQNRIVLLCAVLFSLTIPVLDLSFIASPIPEIEISKSLSNLRFNTENIQSAAAISPDNPTAAVDFLFLMKTVYALVSGLFLFRFVMNLVVLIKKGLSAEKINHRGTMLSLVEEKTNPYNFFQYIFINGDDYVKGNIAKELILHEMAHKKQRHSLDIVFMELIRVFYWFNPFIYLFKNLIRANHEYLADEFVIESGASRQYYSHTLINKTFPEKVSNLVSGFNHLLIKKRLKMLSRSKLKKRFAYQLGLFIPIMLVLFIFTAFTNSHDVVPTPKDMAVNTAPLNKNSGFFYADTVIWLSENHHVFMRGKVKVKHGDNDFNIVGGVSFLPEVYLLLVNGETAQFDSPILLTGIKCGLVALSPEEAMIKYGERGKNGAVEITANKK